jgi:acetylornithine deacetylase/succinyl-diaminopimelate desuccinylase-like protein
MKRLPYVLVLLLATVAGAQPPPAGRYAVDWNKTAPEIVEHFSALLRLDTSNPPGNETLAAKYLQSVLQREGIPARLFALDPSRANLVARLKGNGSKRPLLVMGHTDVVGVQREKWTVDPFAAIRKGGFIYGRGAVDDKDNVTAGLMLLLLLKRLDVKLDRDVIFLAEAGEESTTRFGIDFMVEKHWNEIEAEYAFAEGGGGSSRDGQVRYLTISTTEKLPRGTRLIARGTAGHGSRPRPDNAVSRLAAAVAKVAAWQPPMRLNDTTRTYFERLAAISPPEQAARYTHLVDPQQAPAIERYFAQHELAHYSILRTSISPTMIRAGFRGNVIPSEAEAYLDIRALPDEDMDQFREQLRKVIGDENVEVVAASRTGRPGGAPSRLDTAGFQALERAQKRLYPEAVTLPIMLTGATDLAQLRAKGVQAYGFGPVVDEAFADRGGAHGDDERILETSLLRLVEFLWYATLEVAASR